MNQPAPEPKILKKIKLLDYAISWLKYLGALFTKLSQVADVFRDHFADLHIPKKSDFYE